MKKLLVLFLASLIIFGCQKKEQENIEILQEGEVHFNAIQIDPVLGFKSTDDEWFCPTDPATGALLEPAFAKIVIDGYADPFWAEVFELDGNLYTQAIKLPVTGDGPETYTVTFFGLYTDLGGTLIMATPTPAPAPYADYTSTHVSFPFEVNKFAKAEVPVEVLCYMPDDYENFGFDWYQVTEIVIREQCFFGDICVDDPELYVNSIYNSQGNGVQIDMPAIFYIDVTLDGEVIPYSPFGNTSWFGEGAPLCVQYPDNLSIDGEEFIFEMYVLVLDNTGEFNYQWYKTWTFYDNEMIPTGGDGIVDFVIGDCNLIPPDVTFPPLAPVDPPDPPIPTCETAFAYGDSYATCFIDIPNLQGNRWGWTNGTLIKDVSYSFDIYAAAGQCDLSKGTLVGTLEVDYHGGSAVVTYNMLAGFTMYGVHIYVGDEVLPRKNGEYTTAPGQYPVVVDDLVGETTFSHTFSGLSGEIYVVAHAVVCGQYQ